MKSQIGSFFSSFCSLLITCYFRDKIPMFKTSYRIFQFLHICFTSWSGVGLSIFISPPIKRCFMNLVKTSHRLLLYFKRLFYLVEWCNMVFGLKYLYKIVAQNIWSKIGLFPFFSPGLTTFLMQPNAFNKSIHLIYFICAHRVLSYHLLEVPGSNQFLCKLPPLLLIKIQSLFRLRVV